MKRLVTTLLLAAILLGLFGTAGAETPVSVMIDGQILSLRVAPVVVDGTTLVPVRGIFEHLGGKVDWDPATRTATVTKDRVQVSVTVDSPAAQINGKQVTLLVAPRIVNGSTMVPLRVISEALGAEVRWHEATRTVEVTTRVGGTITFATKEPSSLLPYHLADDSTLTGLLFDSLFRYDDQMQPHPSLALSYREEQGGMRYSFDLRPDVKWHDGQPLTVRDVLFTFQLILHPQFNSPEATILDSLHGVSDLLDQYQAISQEVRNGKISTEEGIRQRLAAWQTWTQSGAIAATGDHSVTFELTKPYAPALFDLATQPILPAHLYGRIDPSQIQTSPEAKLPIGTGPYKFTEWVKGQHLTLTRNPDWRWGVLGTRPRIQEVRFRFIVPGDQHLLLLAGEADVATFTISFVPVLNRLPDHLVNPYYPGNYSFIGYDLTNPLFTDRRVRMAITHAIDREALAQTVIPGNYGQVVHSHQANGRWDFNPDVPQFAFNLSRAEQLLDEAGWKRGASGTRERDGVPFHFELAVNDNPIRVRTAVFLQESLKKVGIDVKISVMTWAAFLDYIDSPKRQAFLSGWSMGWDPDSTAIFHSQGTFKDLSNFSLPAVEQLLEQGVATTDYAKRKPIYQEFQRLIAEEQLYTWLYRQPMLLVRHPRVQGILTDRMGPAGPTWHIENWYIEEER